MYNIKDYINFSALISKVLELETINREIDIDILSSLNTTDERISEFVATNNIEGDITSRSQAISFIKNSDKEQLGNTDLEKRWIGVKRASEYIWSSNFIFDIEHIHQAHRALLKDANTPGGIWKTKINQVGSLITTHPKDVPEKTFNLFTTYLTSRIQGDSLFNIIPFISEFLAIHPYEDGNGRMSRLLFNWMTYNAGYKFTKYVSISKFLWEGKDRYIGALESRNTAWGRNQMTPQDLIPLFDIFLDTLISAAKHARKLSRKVKYTESHFKEELLKTLVGEKSFSEIKETLNMSNSTPSIKKWLAKLVEENVIKKTGVLKSTKYYL